ncbi:hypothetical protein HYS30_03520 [Candidatus Peregrinibacteria bacterium]|nr:hypothetical protein [Candidatus Peregrinibacteria bacterium]
MLAGNRNTDGSFANQSTNANIWSSTESATNAWNRNLNSGNATVNRNANNQAYGFSVRCLKDWATPISCLRILHDCSPISFGRIMMPEDTSAGA